MKKTMIRAERAAAYLLAVGLTATLGLLPRTAHALELITNGNFEVGGLAGWTTAAQAGSSGGFLAAAVDATVPTGNPFAIDTPPNALGGTTFALSAPLANSSSSIPGDASLALYQSFTVPAFGFQSVTLSYQYFGWDPNGAGTQSPPTLDYTLGANLQARVDLLRNGSPVFSVAGADVLRNFFTGVDTVGGNAPSVYQTAGGTTAFNLTSLLTPGATYVLRIAAVNNQGNLLYFGVDNVSVNLTPPAGVIIPEASTAMLFAPAGLLAVAAGWRRRRRRHL